MAGGQEDVSRLLKALPGGTLQGLEELSSFDYWASIMKQAEIDVSNEELFRYRFGEVGSSLAMRLAFLAGTGEFSSFNTKYLISNIVEQCAEMHKYTRKLEKYCVKLQQKVEEVQKQKTQAQEALLLHQQQLQQDVQAAADHGNHGKKRDRSPSPDDSLARV